MAALVHPRATVLVSVEKLPTISVIPPYRDIRGDPKSQTRTRGHFGQVGGCLEVAQPSSPHYYHAPAPPPPLSLPLEVWSGTLVAGC